MADAKKGDAKSGKDKAYKGDYLDDTDRETAGCSVMISYARKGISRPYKLRVIQRRTASHDRHSANDDRAGLAPNPKKRGLDAVRLRARRRMY